MNILPQQIKQLVNYGPNDYRLVSSPLPVPKANELLVKISACGVCASDVHCFGGAQMFWGSGSAPSWVKPPVVPGHEFYGEVAGYGAGALEHFGVALGDRVIAEQIVPCDKCRFCKSGDYWMCEKHDIYGFQAKDADGGMSEYMLLKATSRVHKIPTTLTMNECAVIEPFACSVHAVNRADIQFEDVVVLAGAGTLGLGMVQAIRLKTPKKLIVLDTIPERLALAKKFGADLVMNPLEEDVVARVKALTDGYGCDVYIEATGNPRSVPQGLNMIRKMGRFVEFSVFSEEATVDWSIIGDRKELDIRGAHLGPNCYQTVIDFFERKLFSAEGVVTDTYSLDDWQAAFHKAHGAESVKVLLIP
ncbi:MAG: alcohol dehydrogenase catalytic domain-containing protein [Rouxiella aceris]|uniref:zinc-binding dehydrogenase n=1 Tax=Rouxiella aceris TaxID=2703884 RepID=UPI0028468E0F|nr:alcohol dehydrogenase catalytic domain-containing protein [Rouxiella aceris]MDR3431345.1 alcohol dehydrogenase catalytic domain-containing protein [Rouxiella aceris]